MNTLELLDAELVARFRNGEEKAFEMLVHRYKSKIYTSIYFILKDRELAHDLLQDTFVKAVDKLRSGKYHEEGKFLPWIQRLAHNICIDFLRKNNRLPTVDIEERAYQKQCSNFIIDGEEKKIAQSDTKTILRQLIHQLPFEQRQVLLMRHFADMSFKEIAETTDASLNTTLGRMRYALKNLRKKLEENNIAYDQELYRK